MPIPLIPFLLGAATGAVVTYLVTDRRSGRSGDATSALPKSAATEEDKSGALGSEPTKLSKKKRPPEED